MTFGHGGRFAHAAFQAVPISNLGSYSHVKSDRSGIIFDASKISIQTILPSSVMSKLTPTETSATPEAFSSDNLMYAASISSL
jgi:hypothetical protein